MPARKVPCVDCGTPHGADAERCWACNVKRRKGEPPAVPFRDPQSFRVDIPVTLAEEFGGGYAPPFTFEASDREMPSVDHIRVLAIPDTQVKQGVNLDHLDWVGQYIAEKRPDAILHLGDHYDLPSLSSYDKGKKGYEARRLKADIEAGDIGLEKIVTPAARESGYHPRWIFLRGNHEDRIKRLIDLEPNLEGIVGPESLRIADYGWEDHPFLEVVNIGGVEASHYFVSGPMGRPVSSAAVLLRERMGSAIQGHVQKVDIAVHPKTGHIAMMAGIFYSHFEEYLTPQGQSCRQQVVMLNEVRNGRYDPMLVSLDYLRRRYA